MSTTLPVTEVKARLNELIDSAVSTHDRVTITRRGKPAAVLLSVDDLESLEETLYWQASRASTMTSRLLVGRPTPAS